MNIMLTLTTFQPNQNNQWHHCITYPVKITQRRTIPQNKSYKTLQVPLQFLLVTITKNCNILEGLYNRGCTAALFFFLWREIQSTKWMVDIVMFNFWASLFWFLLWSVKEQMCFIQWDLLQQLYIFIYKRRKAYSPVPKTANFFSTNIRTELQEMG